MKYLLILLLIFPLIASAQVGQGSRATIMVVPWSKKEEDLRQKLEADFNYRAVLNEIRLAFDRKGFSTINFVQKLRNANINIGAGLGNWKTIFKEIIDNSGADIIIEAEIYIVEHKYGKRVEILLEAIETSSSESLANSGLLKSPPFDTEDIATLAEKALEGNLELEGFLNRMDEKFRIIRTIGRSISLRIEVDKNSPYNLQTYVGNEGDYLAELVQDWVQAKCKEWQRNGLLTDISFNIAGREPSLLSYDFLRIPFQDINGERYDINNFSREFRKAISALGNRSEKGAFFYVSDRIERNKLYLTIMN